jgi:thiamine-monophosphate kinase
VTGKLGAAMLGFEALQAGSKADANAYLRPHARLAEGVQLAPLVTAMMDVSDGLLLDAFRLAEASMLSLAIDSTSVPIAAPEPRRLAALTWGDDYELLFTLPGNLTPPVPATRIGTVEPRSFVPLFVDGQPIANAEGLGYQHR